MQLSLTCLGSARRPLQELLDQARDLGFQGVQPVPGELPEDLPTDSYAGFFRFLPSSILDPASSEPSQAPGYSQARIDGWVDHLRNKQVQKIVVEAGLLEQAALRERGSKLIEQLRAEGSASWGSEASESLQAEVMPQAERELEDLARFLHNLLRKAPWLSIALAIEDHPASLLDPGRLRLLREEAGLPHLGYWHDTGRAQSRAALGLDAPGDWLDQHAAVLVGASLHDWADGQDQRLPGDGQVDFRMVAEYLPRNAARVLSVAPVYAKELLPAARDALGAAGLL
jgi:sugar phosphate isomerase/epimerase